MRVTAVRPEPPCLRRLCIYGMSPIPTIGLSETALSKLITTEAAPDGAASCMSDCDGRSVDDDFVGKDEGYFAGADTVKFGNRFLAGLGYADVTGGFGGE